MNSKVASPKNILLFTGLLTILALQTIAIGLITILATHILALHAFLMQAANLVPEQLFAMRFLITLSPAAFLLPPIIGKYADIYGHEKTLLIILLISLLGKFLIIWGILDIKDTIILLGILLVTFAYSNMLLINVIYIKNCDQHNKIFFFSLVFSIIAVMIPMAEIYSYNLNAHLPQPIHVMGPIVANCIFNLISLIILLFLTWKILFQAQTFKSYKNNTALIRFIFSNAKLWVLYYGLIIFIWGIFYQGAYLQFSNNTKTFYELFAHFIIYGSAIILMASLLLYLFFLKKIHLSKLIYGGVLLFGVGFVGHGLFSSYILKNIFIIFMNVGVSFAIPSIWVLLTDEVRQKNYGFLMGILASVWVLSWLLSGVVVRFTQEINANMPIYIGMIAIAVLFTLMFGQRTANLLVKKR